MEEDPGVVVAVDPGPPSALAAPSLSGHLDQHPVGEKLGRTVTTSIKTHFSEKGFGRTILTLLLQTVLVCRTKDLGPNLDTFYYYKQYILHTIP